MFAFVKRSAALAVAMLIGFGAVQSAGAVVINIDPGDSNVLALETTFRTQSEEKLANESFTDVYTFFLPDLGSVPTGSQSVYYSYDVTFPVPEGAAAGIGIADLTFTLTDETNSTTLSTIVLTDASGVAFSGFEGGFNFIGNWPAPIELVLTVTGTALSQGGSYEATIAAVPVPAPLALFISALLGLGFLGRRRIQS